MDADEVLKWLERKGTPRNVEGMARYGIRAARAFVVSMSTMRPLVKRLGKDHRLALTLWETGWHEARILASLVDDPNLVTRRQMNTWSMEFDNWAICNTVCIRRPDAVRVGQGARMDGLLS